jgi:hypothetical protein
MKKHWNRACPRGFDDSSTRYRDAVRFYQHTCRCVGKMYEVCASHCCGRDARGGLIPKLVNWDEKRNGSSNLLTGHAADCGGKCKEREQRGTHDLEMIEQENEVKTVRQNSSAMTINLSFFMLNTASYKLPLRVSPARMELHCTHCTHKLTISISQQHNLLLQAA